MGDHFVTNRIDDTTYDIDLLINDDPNKSEMDILLDDFLGGSDDELDVVSYLSRQEYSNALSCNDSREMEDSGVIVAGGLFYGLPGENEPDEELKSYPQAKDKQLQWTIMLSSMHRPFPCEVELYVFRRDASGNLHKLHSMEKSIELTLKHPGPDTKLSVHIHSAYVNPLDCGRYYAVFMLKQLGGRYIDMPVAVSINITSPNAFTKVDSTRLVGMESVYRQMASLAQQKRFNDRRNFLYLPPSPIVLHAAVMGGKGSGKTSFAQIIYDFYRNNGLISDGKLLIIDATRWLNLSESTDKISEDMTKARNGVLYIENAASMLPSADTRGNREYAVQALVRELAENTHNTTVILADTPENMTELLAISNLQDFIGQTYHLPELTTDQMAEVAERECTSRGFTLSPEAKAALKSLLRSQPNATTSDVLRTVDTIIMNMSVRVVNQTPDSIGNPSALSLIQAEDVPQAQIEKYDQSIEKLNALVGLNKLKYNIESHLNLVRFAQLRSRNGLQAAMPPLHMIFTGNPGTGKTTVAGLLGEIYASLGILKTGNVIVADRKKLVGRYIGDTEDNTKRVLQQAHGNILFIDEAYNLVGDPDDKKDFGPKVLDCLLEELSKEQTDMIIILAGYPDEMDRMLKSNKGLQSRFPYTFHFEDYSEAELLEIAIRTAANSGYSFSDQAAERLKTLIHKELTRNAVKEQKHFGNARFITRLISTRIIPNMSRRVLAATNTDTTTRFLSLIEAEDIPAQLQTDYAPDETRIARTLRQLDEMVGLQPIKQALHDLVTIARSRALSGEDIVEAIPLQWTFTGSTGTGKSSVARLLAQLLHAFHLISSDKMTQLRLTQSPTGAWTPYDIDKILRDTMRQSGQGLLFIDLDDVANNPIDVQWLRCKLTSLTAEMPGSYAFVIAVDDRSHQTQPIDMPLSTSVMHFEDYTAEQLMDILSQKLQKQAYCLSDEARQELSGHIRDIAAKRRSGFANARTIRHIFTAITCAADLRRANNALTETPVVIEAQDIRSFTWQPLPSNRIGFGA